MFRITAYTFMLLFPLVAGASGWPANPKEQVRVFATCSGRLSAMMEHQWIKDGPAADRTKARRDLFVDMIDAVLPDATDLEPRRVFHWRLRAKAAHSALLQDTVFSTDMRRVREAERLAQMHISQCEAILLG